MNLTKWITAAALALILVGIAYVQAIFSNQESHPQMEPALNRPQSAEALEGYISRDKHVRALDSLKQTYSDSLTVLDSILIARSGGLIQEEFDSLKAHMESLSGKLDATEKQAEDLKNSKTRQYDRLIYKFYAGEMSSLPADLSAYERQVSIKEIKKKAKDYFGISTDALNEIIKENKQ